MSATALDVLLIEDEALDAQLVRRSLRGGPGEPIRLHHVTTLSAGLERLGAGDIGAVLLDLGVPDSEGIDTVERLRARDASVPVVVFTGASDDATAVAALAAGAQDYLVKDELAGALLQRSIRHAVERQRIAARNARRARRLREAEKLETLGSLCGGIAFGFNEHLGAIFERCESALASLGAPAQDARLRRCLLEIHRAAFQIAEMAQRLRDYALLERAAGEQVELARFVVEAQDLLAAIVSTEVDVACEGTGGPLHVEIARPELHRLLLDLVVNAAEAIGDARGAISISTGAVQADATLLADSAGAAEARPGRYAVLRVADTGRGLEPARRERLFDPFYTTKRAGRGLGLASVLGIVRRRGGVVRIEANRPSGSVFSVLLPLQDDAGAAPPAAARRPARSRSRE
jgi:signal transduction histidine kinase